MWGKCRVEKGGLSSVGTRILGVADSEETGVLEVMCTTFGSELSQGYSSIAFLAQKNLRSSLVAQQVKDLALLLLWLWSLLWCKLPGLGTSTCCRHGRKQTNKRNNLK